MTNYGKVELRFNANFHPKWKKHYAAAQQFIDSEVLKRCDPYTPFLTGTLIRSGLLGTELGSGKVKWIVPYARKRYYTPAKHEAGRRGAFWFERWKAAGGAQLIRDAKAFLKRRNG